MQAAPEQLQQGGASCLAIRADSWPQDTEEADPAKCLPRLAPHKHMDTACSEVPVLCNKDQVTCLTGHLRL